MKAVRTHHRSAGPDGLVLEDVPYPHAAENDVVVAVHTASFTRGELTWPGTWTDRTGRNRAPTIPGHEVSGVVAELGLGTTGLTVGQRVFGLTDWARDGALAEFVAVEARNLAPLPAAIDHARGAALPLAGLTAWQGLFDHGHLEGGQTVLVHGAAGAVGSTAVQLARDAGARVIGTGRTGHRRTVLDLGADSFVDLDSDPVENSGEVDVVFDTLGGDVLDRSAALVRPGGALVSIAAPPTLRPENGRSLFFVVEPDRHRLSDLAQRVVDGRLHPLISAVHPLHETRLAFTTRPPNPGKQVIRVTDE